MVMTFCDMQVMYGHTKCVLIKNQHLASIENQLPHFVLIFDFLTSYPGISSRIPPSFSTFSIPHGFPIQTYFVDECDLCNLSGVFDLLVIVFITEITLLVFLKTRKESPFCGLQGVKIFSPSSSSLAVVVPSKLAFFLTRFSRHGYTAQLIPAVAFNRYIQHMFQVEPRIGNIRNYDEGMVCRYNTATHS